MGEARGRKERERRDAGPAGSTVVAGQPVVAIVGYPNVGKSTLFNRLTESRDAVVDPIAGVTRDRRQGGTDWRGRAFQIVDTGGIDDTQEDPITRQVVAQADRAIGEADLILFVVDARAGLTAGDMDVADRLRGAGRPVIIVANKAETVEVDAQAASLWSLGLGDVVTVSAQSGRGTGDLLDAIVDALPETVPVETEGTSGRPAICILGRPNVGKSSILNALLGDDRAVVHDRPGTTRDPIDTLMDFGGREIVLIDTAGLRRRGRTSEDVERYSQMRSLDAAERSDVAMVVCAAPEGLTDSDLQAVDRAARAGCATLLVVNKWDLAQPKLDDIRGKAWAKSRQRPPVEVCSAVSGEGVHRLIPAALRLYDRYKARIPTHELNEALRELAAERPGPMRRGKRLSLRYLVQTGSAPPRFRLEVNDRSLMTRDYGLWLENRLRRRFDMEGVPMIIEVRGRRG